MTEIIKKAKAAINKLNLIKLLTVGFCYARMTFYFLIAAQTMTPTSIISAVILSIVDYTLTIKPMELTVA